MKPCAGIWSTRWTNIRSIWKISPTPMREILVELLDVVMTRYQRSMRTAKGYHLALIALAGASRAAAARRLIRLELFAKPALVPLVIERARAKAAHA